MYVWKDFFLETAYSIYPLNAINNKQASKPTNKHTRKPMNQQTYILDLKSGKTGCGTLKSNQSWARISK